MNTILHDPEMIIMIVWSYHYIIAHYYIYLQRRQEILGLQPYKLSQL